MQEQDESYESREEPEEKEGRIRDYLTGYLIKARPEEIEARQTFEKRLVEEYGYSPDQISGAGEEFWIQKGSQKIGPADIIVFRDSRKTFDNIFLIIETKRKDRKDGINQLESYLNPTSAEGGVWFNGEDIVHIRMLRNPTRFIEWRNIPKKGQSWEEIGKFKKADDLTPAPDLKSTFKVIYYHLYTNSNLPRAERLGGEMTRLIFCKIYDEIHNRDDLKYKAGAEEQDNRIAERIKELFEKVKIEYNTDVFDKDEKLLLDNKSIAYVASQLQDISLLNTDKDATGDAFEVFIGPGLRGEKGQFFTPRNVVRMTVEMLDPKPDDKIIDPACGSGGFLIVALEHVWKKIEDQYKQLSKERIGSKKTEIASKNFFGIDKEFDLAKVCKAYMAIVGDGRSGIFCADSLEDPESWSPIMREKIKIGSFDVLMTNPPFGAKIPITSRSLLEQYDLGYKWKNKKSIEDAQKTNIPLEKQVPQILFIERCLELLRPGGRMGIVLPDGIIGNVEDTWIRKFILNKAKILAVVDCPPETFQPSTSTKTSVLFLQKKIDKETVDDYPIYMGVAEKCGHNRRGKPVYKDGTLDDDLPDVARKYREFRKDYNVYF